MKQEKRALLIIKKRINNVVGGWENAIEDGYEEVMPTKEQLAKEVYEEVIMVAEKEVRFLGVEKIKQLIHQNL